MDDFGLQRRASRMKEEEVEEEEGGAKKVWILWFLV